MLDTKGSDEDVDHDYDEDKGCGGIFHDVQLVVHAYIIQVPLNWQKKNETWTSLLSFA